MNSDSGLSVLASSLFSGMEGIEVGGGTVIGQDGQGNQDSQAIVNTGITHKGTSQDKIGSNSEVPGLILSPRKTRSGRLVKYKDSK